MYTSIRNGILRAYIGAHRSTPSGQCNSVYGCCCATFSVHHLQRERVAAYRECVCEKMSENLNENGREIAGLGQYWFVSADKFSFSSYICSFGHRAGKQRKFSYILWISYCHCFYASSSSDTRCLMLLSSRRENSIQSNRHKMDSEMLCTCHRHWIKNENY